MGVASLEGGRKCLFTRVYGSLGVSLDVGIPDSSTLLLCCTVSKGVTFWCTLGENTGLLVGTVSCKFLLCCTTSKGVTINWCTLGEDIGLFLGTDSGTILLCCNVPKGAALWITLGENTGSLLSTTVRGDVLWARVDNRLIIRANWMNKLVVGIPKVSDGLLLCGFWRMCKIYVVA